MQQCSFVKIKARQMTKFTMISIPCDVFHLLYFSRCFSIPLAVGGWNFSAVDFEIITFVMINVIVVVQIEKKKQNKELAESWIRGYYDANFIFPRISTSLFKAVTIFCFRF